LILSERYLGAGLECPGLDVAADAAKFAFDRNRAAARKFCRKQPGTNGGRMDSSVGSEPMLMTTERRPAIRTLRGWAISVLQDASAKHAIESFPALQWKAHNIRLHNPGLPCP
jgi:hypothetical protein